MAEYNGPLDEKNFYSTLEKSLNIITSGMKVGVDNLELILDNIERINLGPMVDILNRCEIEYKQGKNKKIEALNQILKDHASPHPEKQNGFKNLFGKCKELESIHGAYINAGAWLTYLNFGRYSEATPPTDDELFVEAVKYFAGLKDDSKMPETIYAAHFGDDPAEWFPPSNTKATYFHSTKEIRDLDERLENEIHHTGTKINVREDYRKDIMKLKEMSADKFAYTRAEILGMLDLYKEYKLPASSE